MPPTDSAQHIFDLISALGAAFRRAGLEVPTAIALANRSQLAGIEAVLSLATRNGTDGRFQPRGGNDERPSEVFGIALIVDPRHAAA